MTFNQGQKLIGILIAVGAANYIGHTDWKTSVAMMLIGLGGVIYGDAD